MAQATQEVAAQAKAERLGIQVIDLRIKHADLPEANAEAVYQRMKTERQQMAAQIRAVGEQKKREIMAEADKEVTVTIATADGDAARIHGDGDAQRAILFAKSFGRDPASPPSIAPCRPMTRRWARATPPSCSPPTAPS